MARNHKADAHARRAIAARAARLIAEDGQTDYGVAKRKAARQLGFRESDGLPDNAEIEVELRHYQALYQNDEQRSRLRDLRETGLTLMQALAPHHPFLSGPVWKGTATRGARLDIDVFTDEAKLLELWMVNRGVPFTSGEKPHFLRSVTHRVPVYRFAVDGVDVAVSVFSRADERSALRHDACGQAERGNASQVRELLSAQDGEDQVERFLAAIR